MPTYSSARVFKIAESMVNQQSIRAMLQFLDQRAGQGIKSADDWWKAWMADGKHSDDSSDLIEVAGRMCYKSFGLGLNSNLTRVRADQDAYIGNILDTHHGSVLSHASVTFAICGISRVGTHELVRHGVGTAFSQESMRFVHVESIHFYYPDALYDKLSAEQADEAERLVDEALRRAEESYKALSNLLLTDPNMPFAKKKKISSAMRRILPDGILTDIVMTANHRAWRNILGQRGTTAAEEEIRKIAVIIARILKGDHPAIYQDMTIYKDPEEKVDIITFLNEKI